MDILLIGNGFDIAHGLPTTYGDFLKFMKVISSLFQYRGIPRNFEWYDLNDGVKTVLEKNMSQNMNKTETELKLLECAKNNFWINYFLGHESFRRENWVDFEKEISKVVQEIEQSIDPSDDEVFLHTENDYLEKCLKTYCQKAVIAGKSFTGNISYCYPDSYNISLLPKLLKNHLDELIEALEIYLVEYVEPLINKNYISPDIQEIYNTTKVVSFNYTHTYSLIYDRYAGKTPIHYIHGEVRKNIEQHSINMVLGIDEYLNKEQRNKKLTFIEFKKYYQRIFKGTGSEYKEWLKELENIAITGNKSSSLYVFGHSLDISDKDVLKELILAPYLKTTIYYHNEDSLSEKIINLVKVIGQDKLIEKTGNGTIQFVRQQNMKNSENF